MAFKPTHYGKVWTHKGTTYRWAYSGNFGQWRKKQRGVYHMSLGRKGGYRWTYISKAWEPSPSRSAVPWRKYR